MAEKVLFGAEFESAGVVRGADAAINKLVELKTTQEKLKSSTEEFKADLKQVEINLGSTSKAMDNLTRSSTTYRQDLAALKTQQRDLLNERNAIAASIDNSIQKNLQLSAVIKEQSKVVTQIQKDHNVAAVAMQKFTSINQLGAQALNNLRGQVISAGTALVSGFVGGIIAQAIPAIIQLVQNCIEGGNALVSLRDKQRLTNEVFDQASQAVGKDVAQLEIFRLKLNDTNIPASERIRIAQEYNKTAEKTNQIDTTQIDNLKEINKQIAKQNELIIQRAVSLAATEKLGGVASEFVDAQLKVAEGLKRTGLSEEEAVARTKNLLAERKKLVDESLNVGALTAQGRSRSDLSQLIQNIDAQTEKLLGAGALEKGGLLDNIELRDKAKQQLDETAQFLSGLISAPGLTKFHNTPKEIENVFLQKLAELRARLASLSANEFQSEGLIRNKFSAILDKEFQEIAQLLKEKKLTGPQAGILRGLLQQINEVSLDKELFEFRKKQADALQKIDDLILTASIEDGQKRVANIRNEFEKEAQTIDASFNSTTAALNKRLRESIKQIQDDVDKGLITGEQGQKKTLLLTAIFGDLLTQAGIDRTNRQLELAFKVFQDTINNLKLTFDNDALVLSEETTDRIRVQTQKFTSGQETYKTYQENLTKILKEETNKRRLVQLAELQEELRLINQRLAANTDPEFEKKLVAQQRAVRSQISSLSREIAEGGAADDEAKRKKKTDAIVQYAQAIGGLMNSILSFWQEVNKAEEASLNRSIALQQRRVDNAKDIAAKGNAEYLEQEQKRLDELERRRDENARKQLAINNALTLSNATVAAITAIAQAVQTGSPFAALAAVAAVIGAIAAAYSFVNSLQPQVAQFYEGEEEVRGTGRPRGKDTVPAMLTIGERVVPADKNKKYWDTLHAVHMGAIPAEVLNSFVNQYQNFNYPELDLARLSNATSNMIGLDSMEVLHKLDLTNEKLENVVDAISGLGLNVSMDEDGFSASLEKHQTAKRLRNRA
jgi:hypothetical protein